MIHQREMSVPASDTAKKETCSLSIASADITNPIGGLVCDGFFAAVALTPNKGIYSRQINGAHRSSPFRDLESPHQIAVV